MIEVSNLVKFYGKKIALQGISFTVGDKEVVGFLGPNGAGKTTTLNILTGYLSANSGTAKIDGIDIFEYPDEAKKKIGFLPEQPPLYREMKVGEYLSFVYDLKKCRYNKKKHLEEVMKVTKVYDVRNRLISNLSKGYCQRVGIAEALVGNPDVIILDEPTVGLDPKQIIEVRNLIRTLGKTHTVILSSHILSEIQSVCSRVIIINDGRIVADEKTDSIIKAVNNEPEYIAKIIGPDREVTEAVKNVPGVASVKLTGERDGDGKAYRIKARAGYDIRRALFETLSKHSFPLIGLENASSGFEEAFIKITDFSSSKQTK